MTMAELFEELGRIKDFPTVEIEKRIRNHPNTLGKIDCIRPNGVSVNLGAGYSKWFHFQNMNDKRTNWIGELKIRKEVSSE